MSVRIRGIYTTALTALLDDVVQASAPIERRFDGSFPVTPAAATVETTRDRQGVGVHGSQSAVTATVEQLEETASDTFAWAADLPVDGVYAGEVTETGGGGAVLACGDNGDKEGYLPFDATARHIESGDRLRVQVTDPEPPWSDRRPRLDTDIRVSGGLVSLVRGRTTPTDGPALTDVVPADPPDGWGVSWGRAAEDASFEALGTALETAAARGRAIDRSLSEPADELAPGRYWADRASWWVWFGRESRWALDDRRRTVTPTMVGHHRIKAGAETASAAVDFVESVCGSAAVDGAFPFDAVTRQFGPTAGDEIAIGHGKPDGRRYNLGPATVTDRSPDGTVTVERELTPGGTYDALGTAIQAGDTAVTKLTEDRWWYPTVYRGSDGTRRGTYVNVCTPVELFPDHARYVDLHVDVVHHADGRVERVDDDELAAAVEADNVTPALARKARDVADAVASAL